jgi:glycosyltransferase involved in cell wall biosynthesis
MMKFLILFSGEYPGKSPGFNRLRYYVKGMNECGAESNVISLHLASRNFISQLWNEFRLPFILLWYYSRDIRMADHILVYEFNWFTYYLLKFTKRASTRIYLEVNEKPGTGYSSRFLEIPLIKWFNLCMVKASYRLFDGFIVISDKLEAFIREEVGKTAQIITVPILTDPFCTIPDSEFILPAHRYIVHSGALSQIKDGIIDVFRAFAAANKRLGKGLHFYLTSDKAPKEVLDNIREIIRANRLQDNVHFIGELEENDLRRLQGHCEFVIINKIDNQQNQHNFPTKLGEYMMLQRPVIATCVGELSKYLFHDQNAIVLTPGDTKALEESIVELYYDREKALKIGQAGRLTAQKEFDYRPNIRRMYDFFQNSK